MRSDRRTLATLLSLAAGSLDTATGLLLVLAPGVTLRLFGATLPGGGDDILMRFVGTFVGGVGLSYLWALGTRRFDRRMKRLVGVWGATTVIRACIAVFTTTAVLLGRLETAWLVVAATDAALAIVQAWGLRNHWFEE